MLSDYNCKIFEINKYRAFLGKYDTQDVDIANLISDVEALGKCGFHRLISLFCHRPYNSVSQTKRAVISLNKKIKETVRLNNFKISFVPSVFLTEDAPYIKNIGSLAIPHSNFIFVESPVPEMPDYYPITINKLLYHCKLIPIFSNFQACCVLYPHQEIEKLIRIKSSAFQFSLESSYTPQCLSIIRKILSNGNTVLLGTGCTHAELNAVKIAQDLAQLKKSLGYDEYSNLIMRSHKFPM